MPESDQIAVADALDRLIAKATGNT